MKDSKFLFPIESQLVKREEKEKALGQRGIVLWLTGLSGSGKSTIARILERKLFEEGRVVKVLDGDGIRNGLNANLGFSLEDRVENIRRIAEVAKLFTQSGIVTICSFISPTENIRSMAKGIIGEHDFRLVYIDASIEVCESRDVKGLYAKARKGEIKGFTGIDSPFETPLTANVILTTEGKSAEENADELLRFIETIK